ncbi:MAG TPA: hypothetical protein VHE57_10650, partial [Mycobacteriales bacterium]|nr:hypothetical protein [Mycobacteriales bacterium]
MTTEATPHHPHPLDPLTEAEVHAANAIWRADERIPDEVVVHVAALHEAPKDELAAHVPGAPVDRRVRYLLRCPKSGMAYNVVVSVTRGAIDSLEQAEDSHPPYGAMELYAAGEAARNDPRFVSACKDRGVDDMTTVQLDPWPAGRFNEPWE